MNSRSAASPPQSSQTSPASGTGAADSADAVEEISESRIHANPQKGAYRRWFERLNPSLQMILLQMWMPTFMAIMFVLCYVGGFQHISPHHVPVDVVGEPAAVAKIQAGVDKAMPNAWDFSVATSRDRARSDVKTGRAAAAYVVGDNTIIIASAHQAQAAQLVPQYLEAILKPDKTPKVDDVAPLPPGDLGMSPMYLMLTWCISGYLAAMFIGLMGGPLRRLTRFGVIIGGAIVLTFLSSLLAGPVLGAFHVPFYKLWGLGICWAISVGVAVNGLSYFCGRFIAAPSMLLFIFLSIPSSGAAMPKWFVGEPFAWLNHVVVGSGITEMLKRLVYDVGPGYSRGWIMMACYLGAGILLTVVGKPYWEWLRVRRMLTGRTTMMQEAQRANGRMHDAERTKILARYGLEPGPDGMVIRMAEPPAKGRRGRAERAGQTPVSAGQTATTAGRSDASAGKEPPAITGPLFAVPTAEEIYPRNSENTAGDAAPSAAAPAPHTSSGSQPDADTGTLHTDDFHDPLQDPFGFNGSLEQTFDPAGSESSEDHGRAEADTASPAERPRGKKRTPRH